jgi:hypothetical protein
MGKLKFLLFFLFISSMAFCEEKTYSDPQTWVEIYKSKGFISDDLYDKLWREEIDEVDIMIYLLMAAYSYNKHGGSEQGVKCIFKQIDNIIEHCLIKNTTNDPAGVNN